MLLLEEGKERKVRKENLKKRTLFFIIKEDSRVIKYWLLSSIFDTDEQSLL